MATKTQQLVNHTHAVLQARTEAAAQAAHQLIDRAAERAGQSEQALRHSAQFAQQTVQGTLRTVRNRTTLLNNSLQRFIRRHPLASMGLAVGFGVVLATRARPRAGASVAVDEVQRAADSPPIH